MRTHLSLVGGALMLLIAVGTYLGTYGFVSSSSGLIHGGMYTDINARLPMRYVIAGLAALAGIVTMASAFLTRQRLPAAGVRVRRMGPRSRSPAAGSTRRS